jgi:MFS family permease
METLILGWYVLVETNSVLLLTLFAALQFSGTLVAPVFGVAGDRIGHRNLLCGMRVVYTILATTVMGVALAGTPNPVIVLTVTALMGLVRPSDLGVRSALIADAMPTEQLVPALGISRTTSDMARVIGALTGAGLFAAFGLGRAYIVVASFYALGSILTSAIASPPGADSRRPPSSRRVPQPGGICAPASAMSAPDPSCWPPCGLHFSST